MRIAISVCTDDGWKLIEGSAPNGNDTECYALPKDVCRSGFWSKKLGQPIPVGRALIWTILES